MKRGLLLMFIIVLSIQSAFGNVGNSTIFETSRKQSDHISESGIDQLNALANRVYTSNPAYARKLAGSALLDSKLINYKKGIGQSFLNIGITYWSQAYYAISMLYADSALHYLSTDRLLTSDCYRYIGRDYTEMKDFKSAIVYLTKAQDIAGSDVRKTKDILADQSYYYLKRGEFDKVLTTTAKALVLCKQLKDENIEGILYSRFAATYVAKKQYDKTLAYCDTGLTLSYRTNNLRLKASLFIAKAKAFIGLAKLADGLSLAKQARALSDSLGFFDMSSNSYKLIISVYNQEKNPVQALYYQQGYSDFLEKRFVTYRETNSQLMHDYFDLNNKLQDINQIKHSASDSNTQIKSQQQLILVLLISLMFVAAAVYVVFFYYRRKNTLAEQLQQQNAAILKQSELIEAQSQHLEELNGFKSRLLAIIGHDLRVPINNLSNITDMFEDGLLTNDEVRTLMRSANPIVKSAELTLSNLLIWAGAQLESKSIEAAPVNILTVLEEAEQIFRHQLDKKGIKVICTLNANYCVMVAESHLKVIFNNLVSNAIKFTEPNGCITIGSELKDGKIITTITDTGIGMTEAEVAELLSAKHFSKPGTQGERGTGIGLRLCRELVELNGGKMWLTSAPGKGTIFYFSFVACL